MKPTLPSTNLLMTNESIPVPSFRPLSWLELLNIAVNNGDTVKTAALLADHKKDPSIGDVNARSTTMTGGSGSALHLAIRRSHVAVVAMLLQHPKMDVHALSEMGFPPLWCAAVRSGPIVDMLLDAGADPWMNVVDKRGKLCPLAQAAVSDIDTIVMDMDINPRTRMPSTLNRRPFQSMARHHLSEMSPATSVLDVLNRRGLLPTSPEDLAQLLVGAVQSVKSDRSTDSVAWLLDHGASLNGLDEHGENLTTLASKFRETAPMTFRLMEQAVLREQTFKDTFTVAPRRSRL